MTDAAPPCEHPDAAAREAVLWNNIANLITIRSSAQALVGCESDKREGIATAAASDWATIVCQLACALHAAASTPKVVRAEAVTQAAPAAAPPTRDVADQWAQVAMEVAAARRQLESLQVEERDVRARVARADEEERRLHESLLQRRDAALAERTTLEAELQRLRDEETMRRRENAALARDGEAARRARDEAAREASELRDAIEHMRSAATALPARLSAAALDVQSPVSPAAVNTPAHAADTSVTSPWTRHLYPTAAATNGGGLTSPPAPPRPFAAVGADPRLGSGMNSLRAVREQLLEFRQASPVQYRGRQMSPPRALARGIAEAASAGVLGHSQKASYPASPVVLRASVGAAPLFPARGPTAADAADTPAALESSRAAHRAVTPWKSRLLKLQSELQSLRAEI